MALHTLHRLSETPPGYTYRKEGQGKCRPPEICGLLIDLVQEKEGAPDTERPHPRGEGGPRQAPGRAGPGAVLAFLVSGVLTLCRCLRFGVPPATKRKAPRPVFSFP